MFYSDFEKKTGYKIWHFVVQNEWQSIITNLAKLIILSQIGANIYQNLILKILLLSPLWSTVCWRQSLKYIIISKKIPLFYDKEKLPWKPK